MGTKSTLARDRATLWRRGSKKAAGFSAGRATLARVGANRLWKLMQENPYINTLGALTGNQAVQQVQAGLKAIYLSGWQVAGDSNTAGEMYPDQSLYPVDSVPTVVRRIKTHSLELIRSIAAKGRTMYTGMNQLLLTQKQDLEVF